ncbi:Transcriptional regulator PadR-like family protein [Actinomadura rubteroloni]|uniref:Transcriptional regulator PadR-like family protein n=1 Tax=Actinomadura rubteroloni TaxID=1926885 RepID=A0A2P4UJF9_9ACTN|nr:helix-turn-helix transcriptional regulator [Actinomadura rubteroloni]POM25195.1 Transcriptional regulator PadR-like family protein [Actinomadura rubteroloni]
MSLRHAVLGLIAELEGASGYDLLKVFDVSLANVWTATQSQIYGELGRLADDGLIRVAAEGPRGRKEYAITDAGRAEMRRWLTETRPRYLRRDEPMLRVFFFGQAGAATAAALLDAESDALAGMLDELVELDERIPWKEDDLSFYGGLAIEYGKRFMEMRRDWARWARDEVAARDAGD